MKKLSKHTHSFPSVWATTYNDPQTISEPVLLCSREPYPAKRGYSFEGNTVSMKECTWSETMVRVLPQGILVPCFFWPSAWYVWPGCCLPFCCGHVLMPIWPSLAPSAMDINQLGQLCSPICNNLWCTVYSVTFLSKVASTTSAIWAALA